MTFTINPQPKATEPKIHTQYWKGFKKQTEIEPTKIKPTDQEQAITGTWMDQLKQTSQPSALSGALNKSALDGLSLGGSLSAEESRDATQAAREAYSSRGLATGTPAAVAEVLNRDAFSRQRLQERQNFALGVEDQNLKGDGTRTASSAALGGGLLDYFGGIRDRERAATEFDINRHDSRYFFDKKLAADLKAADKNAEAAKKAGNSSMMGQLGGAAIGALAMAFL